MMSDYLESDFTTADNGLDYIFGKMGGEWLLLGMDVTFETCSGDSIGVTSII